MEAVADVYLLSQKFLQDYPQDEYPEIMQKQGRPYSCLIIDTHDDYYICLPFRSSITHKQAFLFKNTQRSQQSHSGLDYKKMVLIKDEEYFDRTVTAMVDDDEFVEAMKNLDKIASEASAYLDGYIAHITGSRSLHPREFDRRYRFSTLPYFHDVIGLDN